MKKIGDLLERFLKLAEKSDEAKEAIVQALKIAGVTLKDSSGVTIRGTIATLKLSPIQKSEVTLKQKKILLELAKNPLTKNITVVR